MMASADIALMCSLNFQVGCQDMPKQDIWARQKKGDDNNCATKRAKNKNSAGKKGEEQNGCRTKRAKSKKDVEQKGHRTKRARDYDVASPLHSRS